MKFSFFDRPKPRTFNYRPVYYDPVKEEAEERRKSLEYGKNGDHSERMRAAIRKRWKTEQKNTDKNNQVIRVFIYMIFSAFAIYLIFFTDFVNRLVSLFLR